MPSDPSDPARIARRHRPGLNRIAIACERCRTRKNKCDGASPVCSECRRAGAECIVLDRLTKRPLPRGHVDTLERENAELRRRIETLENAAKVNVSSTGPQNVSTPLSGSASHTPSDVALESAALGPASGLDGMYVGESGGSFFGGLVQKTLMYSGYQYESGPSQRALRLDSSPYAKHFHGQATCIDDATLPSELVLRLEEAFFQYRWPNLPFLHRPTFRDSHLQVFLNTRDLASSSTTFLVLMVLAMGAVDLARHDRSLNQMPSLCFSVAMSNHFDAVMQHDGIEAVQALLLVAYFALNQSCGINAWHTAGQAVRLAIALGLHRRVRPDSETQQPFRDEMRKRVFWCAYSIDQNVSLALGRPPAIRGADIDVELPRCLNDDDLLTTVRMATSGSHLPSPRDTSTFIHIVKLRRLRSQIQDNFYPAQVKVSDTELQRLQATMHKDLDDWATETPRYNQAKVFTFQTHEWFQITYSQSLLLLYRPSPALPAVSQEGMQICYENAINLITSYSSLYAKNKIAYTWITLHSLLMASITMLYTLWVSPTIRRQTTPDVVGSNIKQCLMLFEVMQETWPLAGRCHGIVQHLGTAALHIWDAGNDTGHEIPPDADNNAARNGVRVDEIGAEYAAWFGVNAINHAHESQPGAISHPTAITESDTDAAGFGVGLNLDDPIFQDFDINLPLMMEAFNDETTWR